MNKGDIEIQVQIEPGDYWLSDPCYTIKDEDWLPWLEACNFREEDNLVGKLFLELTSLPLVFARHGVTEFMVLEGRVGVLCRWLESCCRTRCGRWS